MNDSTIEPLWSPPAERVRSSTMNEFMSYLRQRGEAVTDYWELRDWSVANFRRFWPILWEFFEIAGDRGDCAVAGAERIETAEWFPGGRLSIVENLLRHRSEKTALVEIDMNGHRDSVTYEEVERQVSAVAEGLRELGVRPGDVVAGVMDNSIPTVVACLAAAKLGATWTACSVDFGPEAIVERLGQVSPTVLVTLSPEYATKSSLAHHQLDNICRRIPSIDTIVFCKGAAPNAGPSHVANQVRYDDLLQRPAGLGYDRHPFNQLLYILYSSGTTGAPKCILHGAGGTLLQHVKELGLHVGLKERDTILFYTSCGWMMWNWLISSLFFGATVVLYGGSPIFPSPHRLFDVCRSEDVTVLGVSPRYLEACRRFGVKYDLEDGVPGLHTLLSTGSVLQGHLYDYVYGHIKRDILLSSIAGGSDIISCFCLGSEMLPVYRGESQTFGLAMDVAAYSEDGEARDRGVGELVCRNAFPCRPLGFRDDPAGEKFHSAYFRQFENVWTHGDFIEVTARRGIVFHGRSDATLNVGGVRVGTAEIYRQVEKVPGIVESVAVEQPWGDGSRMLLLVKTPDGRPLERKTQREIKKRIRESLSEDHVPGKIVAVDDLPRTYSGKTVELAVKAVVSGREVRNVKAIENPEALDQIRAAKEVFC